MRHFKEVATLKRHYFDYENIEKKHNLWEVITSEAVACALKFFLYCPQGTSPYPPHQKKNEIPAGSVYCILAKK